MLKHLSGWRITSSDSTAVPFRSRLSDSVRDSEPPRSEFSIRYGSCRPCPFLKQKNTSHGHSTGRLSTFHVAVLHYEYHRSMTMISITDTIHCKCTMSHVSTLRGLLYQNARIGLSINPTMFDVAKCRNRDFCSISLSHHIFWHIIFYTLLFLTAIPILS